MSILCFYKEEIYMGPNPMQKMKRNSILTGVIIGLLIGLILGVMAYFTLGGRVLTTNSGETKIVSVLNKEIKSGGTVTALDIMNISVPASAIPANAVTITGENKRNS